MDFCEILFNKLLIQESERIIKFQPTSKANPFTA